MHNILKRRTRFRDERDEIAAETKDDHPRFSHATWAGIGVGIGALGIGTSLFGANKQNKANAATNAANLAALREQDLNAWKGYLMQRGVDPSGITAYGQLPGPNARAVNTKLPLWATSTTQPKTPQPLPGQGTVSLVRRRAAV